MPRMASPCDQWSKRGGGRRVRTRDRARSEFLRRPLLLRSSLVLREGDLEKAVELYERCAEINPDDYRSPLLLSIFSERSDEMTIRQMLRDEDSTGRKMPSDCTRITRSRAYLGAAACGRDSVKTTGPRNGSRALLSIRPERYVLTQYNVSLLSIRLYGRVRLRRSIYWNASLPNAQIMKLRAVDQTRLRLGSSARPIHATKKYSSWLVNNAPPTTDHYRTREMLAFTCPGSFTPTASAVKMKWMKQFTLDNWTDDGWFCWASKRNTGRDESG